MPKNLLVSVPLSLCKNFSGTAGLLSRNSQSSLTSLNTAGLGFIEQVYPAGMSASPRPHLHVVLLFFPLLVIVLSLLTLPEYEHF